MPMLWPIWVKSRVATLDKVQNVGRTTAGRSVGNAKVYAGLSEVTISRRAKRMTIRYDRLIPDDRKYVCLLISSCSGSGIVRSADLEVKQMWLVGLWLQWQ
jgi:hypothetical protein